MRSKISFFNKGLFFSNLKRFSWACILETIVMFFCFPFNLMMLEPTAYWLDEYTDVLERNSHYTHLANLTICVYAVVLAVLLFRYLHQVKMTTALHGLPVSRIVLFGSTVFSGIVLLLTPIVVNVLLVFLVKGTAEIGGWIIATSVVRWMLYAIMLSMVLFAFATFVGMFVGNPAAQFVFTYILHFLPIAFFGAFMALGQMFLHGFSTDIQAPNWIMELPMMTIAYVFSEPCGYYILLYFALAIVFFALALFAYKKRPLERAGDVVVFEWVKPVFKCGISLCLAIAGFLYIAGISDMDTQNNLFGNTVIAVLWAFVGFCIAQMLVAKTWRIFGAYKEMLAVCLSIGVLFVLYQVDIVGFEKRVPDVDSIVSVEVSGFHMYPSNSIVFDEAENIELISKMHKEMIAADSDLYDGGYTQLEYTLKNGKKFCRAYGRKSNQVKDCFEALSKTQEAKQNGYLMFYEYANRIADLHVEYSGKDYYITDTDKLTEAIRADIDAWDTITEYYRGEPGLLKYHLEVAMHPSIENLYYRHYYIDIAKDTMPRAYAVLEEYIQAMDAVQANFNAQTE